MPIKSTNKWENVLSTISASGSDWGSDWVTTTTPVSTWSVATTATDTPYIWSTSTTPIISSGSYEIIYAPELATREREFPLFDTYNLDSSKGREKFVEAFKDYLLASFHPYITLRIDG